MTREQKIDRYLRIAHWARKRYTVCGRLVTYVGDEPAAWTRIERALARRYLGCA